jgi:hypothetical protein
LAEQFQNVLDDNKTEAFVTVLPLGISTDTPPPLLLEAGKPIAPIATTTEQLLNDDDCRLTFANATLLAYTAPPPPLAAPGTTDVELVTAEHAVKLQLEMRNVTLNPANFSAWGGWSALMYTWGEKNSDNAPPYAEAVPRALNEVKETAEQFVNELPVTAMRESTTVVVLISNNVSNDVDCIFCTSDPTTMATAPPIACTRITSSIKAAHNGSRARRTLAPNELPA